MALSTCRDCNREVSTLARSCVHCGRPRPAGVSAGSIAGSIAVVVLALALTAGLICTAKRACRKLNAKAGWECRDVRAAETDARPEPCGLDVPAPAAPEDRK